MDNRLEEFIKGNLEEFDELTPSPDAWKRIQQATRKKEWWLTSVTGIAVSISMVVGFAAIMMLMRTNSQPSQEIVLSGEVAEAANYYEMQIKQKQNRIYQLAGHNPDVRAGMDEDIAQMDSIMVELRDDLKDNVDNQEVIEAMIQNYRLKLQMLEDILMFLQDQPTEPLKNNHHEI